MPPLKDVLAGETIEARLTFGLFYDYSRKEFNHEQLHFLMLVRAFKGLPAAQNLFPSDLRTIHGRANYIYDHHLRQDADMTINIAGTDIQKIRNMYPQGGFQPETNEDPNRLLEFFDLAYNRVFALVDADVWNRFLSLPHFLETQPDSSSNRQARERVSRQRKILTLARSLEVGLTRAFAQVIASPQFNQIPLSQPATAAASAAVAAPPAQRAFVPYPSAAPAPAPMWSASATLSPSSAASAPAPMWSASVSANSPTAAPAPAARVVKVAVPVAAPAGKNVHQVELLRFNPPPRGKRLLPQLPAELARRRAVIAQRLAEKQPLPAPPPPTSPVPTVRPAIPKPGPHKH